MATNPPADVVLTPLTGEAQPISGWVTTFQLAVVILDPFTNESSWILETAGRILIHFGGADCRAAFVVTATADQTRQFLGPWAEKVLTFADPDRLLAKGLSLNELPAFVQIRQDLSVPAAAEGWDPPEWRNVAHAIATDM